MSITQQDKAEITEAVIKALDVWKVELYHEIAEMTSTVMLSTMEDLASILNSRNDLISQKLAHAMRETSDNRKPVHGFKP